MHHVYIMASAKEGVLYVGSTSNLPRRVRQHKLGSVAGFTKRYAVRKLVYFEGYLSASDAKGRELRLKEWRREWKVKLIVTTNPGWLDLSQRESFRGSFTEGPGFRRGGA